MRGLCGIGCFASMLFSCNLVLGYEVDTHEILTEKAVDSSVLALDANMLPAIGLLPLSDKEEFPNSANEKQTVIDLFRTGANFEDDVSITNLRPINHFFDPTTGDTLLPAFAKPSPSWALEDLGQIDGFIGIFGVQKYSFSDAREYLYKALTSLAENDRSKNFGLTFQTLGHVIHHIQDMAQPQHARLDQHLKLSESDQITWFFENPSLYEQYSNANREKLPTSNADYNSATAVSFATPRQFWTGGIGGDGRGMADFSNANFVSAGTNFLLLDGAAVPARYAEPTPLAETVEPVETLFASKGLTVPPECLAPNPPCTMSFYSSLVWDKYLNKSEINPRASTLSIFDQDLKVYGKKASYTDPDTGTVYTSDRLFALNSFNFDAAHGFLIPRAVAYSAGLINYFFRGKLEIDVDPGMNAKFALTNQGLESMTGTVDLYYDDLEDTRQLLGTLGNGITIAPGQTLAGLVLPPIPADSRKAKTPGEYMAVFRGDMGEEKAIAGTTVGAVTGKLFIDPYQTTINKLMFYVWGTNEYNPAETYGMMATIVRNPQMVDLVALTTETFSLLVGSKTIPCAVYGASLVYCKKLDVWPYEEFYFNPLGDWSSLGPYFSIDFLEKSTSSIKLMLGEVVVFSFDYAVEVPADYAAVTFLNEYRWDTSSIEQLTGGWFRTTHRNRNLRQ